MKLREEITAEATPFAHLADEDYLAELSRIVTRKLFYTDADRVDRARLIDQIYNRTRGLDILQPLMDDPAVTEIMVNRYDKIFYEKDGRIHFADLRFENAAHLESVIVNLFNRVNRSLNLSQPIADARLPDGSRANAVIPPAAPDGPILTLRKFTGITHSPQALLQSGFISEDALLFLREKISLKRSIFMCGGTGTGKTTLLNVLSNFIAKDERVVTIEDSAELQLVDQPNLVRLEGRSAGPDGNGEITISHLIKTSLRMRPDRIIIGEIRGSEAADLMNAMNTGHPGALCTGHGNSCADMFDRLSNLVLEGSQLPISAIRKTLASVIDYMVHIIRLSNGRRVVNEICSVSPGSGDGPRIQPIFKFDQERYQLEDLRKNQAV